MDPKDKKQLAKQRKETAKRAHKFHKEREKQNKKSSAKAKKKPSGGSKIAKAVNERRARQRAERSENLTREEKFRRESAEKLKNLKPQDHEEGYFIDEYGEKKRTEKRAKIIRKQENEVIRKSKKPLTPKQVRLRRILISAGIFLVVVVIGAVLSLTVLFKTEKIDVEGDVYYTDEQITAFSNVNLQQNIFLGAWNSTPEEIVKNLPYVEAAKVGFAVPDTITIKITDAVPTYAVKDGNNYLIVSSKGRILDNAADNADGLVVLNCGEIKNKNKGDYIDFGDESVPEFLDSVAKSFAENGAEKITGFDISDLNKITITYDGRIDINIGLPEDVDYKIKTAFTIINDKLDPNHTGQVYGTLDVSTCNKNKISRYKPSPTVPPTTAPSTAPTEPTQSTEGYDSYNGYNAYNGYDQYGGAYTDNYTWQPDNSYGGNSYGGDAYSGNAYGGDTYSGNSYSGDYYGGNSYGGDYYSGNSYGGDYYSGDAYSGNTYSGNTYAGDTYSGNAYGGDYYGGAAQW